MSKAQYSWAFIGICSDRTNSANPAHNPKVAGYEPAPAMRKAC